MYTFFYYNISDIDVNLQGILENGTYRTTIQNMHKLGCKEQLFKSSDVLMLGRGCGVSQYPQFYEKNENIYPMLPRPYKRSYSGGKCPQFFNNHRLLHYPNQLKHLLLFQ